MCGIAGVWRKDGPASEADARDLKGMMDVLAHRGPDGEGTYAHARVLLGHRRLAIVDPLPRSAQPMRSADGRRVLSFNGEVYNFRDLKLDLEREGHHFTTSSDTEVVLTALAAWGPAIAVPRFNGMFAISYFDSATETLWLARDRLGIKPLSVAETGGRILFASEDKAILACSDMSTEVPARGVIARLILDTRDSLTSLFAGIERVPAGGLWRIRGDTIQRTIYWDPLDALDPARISAKADPAALQSKLETLLENSVALHGISDAPVAAACSGGVDSSLIAALAPRTRPGLPGYVVDPELGASEGDAARRVGAHIGIDITAVRLGRDRFLDLWPESVWAMEAGGWNASQAGLLALSQDCHRDGIKVLLTGEGSDELFGGYRWHEASMKRWQPFTFPARLFAGRGRLRRLAEDLRLSPFAQSQPASIAVGRSTSALHQRIAAHLAPVGTPAERALLGSGIADLYGHLHDLLNRHDRLSMAASLESRVPFLENSLIDFALHLPPAMKFQRKQGKWLLKQVALKHLPKDNVLARKKGFPISPDYTAGSERLLADGLLRDVLGWTQAATSQAIEDAGRIPWQRTRLIGMELFLRLYVGRETRPALSERLKGFAR